MESFESTTAGVLLCRTAPRVTPLPDLNWDAGAPGRLVSPAATEHPASGSEDALRGEGGSGGESTRPLSITSAKSSVAHGLVDEVSDDANDAAPPPPLADRRGSRCLSSIFRIILRSAFKSAQREG